MARYFSIGRRFGALYVLLVALLTIVCVVVVVHVEAMRRDADRLLEETREQVLAHQLTRNVASLKNLLLQASSNQSETSRKQALELEGALQRELNSLHAPKSDPSRREHQEAEDDLSRQARAELEELSLHLGSAESWQNRRQGLDELALIQGFVNALAEETQREVSRADHDLERRARAARTVLILTFLSVTAILCMALLLVMRTVVAPLGVLRDGADRLGGGDLAHRLQCQRPDEIGDLARSLNHMADRLAATHSDLEQRVAARTRELVRAARLADIGVLAAGVAHEINTPLASIASCAEGLERRIKRGSLSREEELDYLGTITAEAYRARDITSRLLALSRNDAGEIGDVDLGLVYQHVRGAVRPLLEKESQHLEVRLPSENTMLQANAGELVQILVNLILNAKDASRPGSTIRLECSLDERWASFAVIDTGTGVAPELVEHIFDPFFTTKAPGKGTGLGLAVVHAMVDSRGGHIEVESELGKGTKIAVFLPRLWKVEGDSKRAS